MFNSPILSFSIVFALCWAGLASCSDSDSSSSPASGGAGGSAGSAGTSAAGGAAGSGAVSGGGGTGGVVTVERDCVTVDDCVLGFRSGLCCGECTSALARRFVEEQPCYVEAADPMSVPAECTQTGCDQLPCPGGACQELVALECQSGTCVGLPRGEGCNLENNEFETAGCACGESTECSCQVFDGANFQDVSAPSTCDPDGNRCVPCVYF